MLRNKFKNLVRELVLKLANLGIPSINFLEKILSLLVMRREFSEMLSVKSFSTREKMWEICLDSFIKEYSMTYLEFGVWRGESILYLSNKFKDKSHKFYGFDSFIGLPETWHTMTGINEAGTFSMNGITPQIKDDRVKFISGWFQNTVEKFVDQLKLDDSKLVVHFDADLYSSTLFCLMQIDKLKTPYLAIFDEIPGDEVRALYNYKQASGANIKFLAKTGPTKNYPTQIAALINPSIKYEIN